VRIVAEADSGEAACQAFSRCRPDVTVMDLSLPGFGGLEATRRIVYRDSDARVLVFSMHEDTAFVEQALQAGARGYITKSSAPETLVAAVTKIAGGGTYLDQQLAQHLAFQKSRGQGDPWSNLSTREFEIFCLLAEGFTSPRIAARLSLSAKTVANYSTQIKAKLGVESNGELVRLAIRHGLIDA
jgi:DNA-binding NarL/FixJ family response regulator